MKDGAEGLEKITVTGNAQQLPPGAAIGMAIGAEIAPAHPAAIGTIWVGAEMVGGVDLAAAPSRWHKTRGRSGGGLWARVGGVRTGVTVRLVGEARKGFWLTLALGPWAWGLQCRRPHRSGLAGPRPMQHDA